ncbi:MAG: IS630 family transposase [Candidatus Hodarchaeales archaeon]
MDKISQIYKVYRDSVSSWLNSWSQSRVEGLKDLPRIGCPPRLTDHEKEIAINLIIEQPRSPKIVLAKLAEKTNKEVSTSTLKRIAKAADLTWKRVRKSLNSKKDEKEFEKAKKEINELKKQQQDGKIDLCYFDESGFSLDPSVPYAWQPRGENIEVPSAKSKRLNVLGFLNAHENQLESFCFQCNVDTRVVVSCFNEFSKNITKETVVILDNASIHTSDEFQESIPEWKKRGLFIKYLPPYSPELNLIETLWRFIKYYWLPFSAYTSFKDLVDEVENILRQFGSEYKIAFA